MTLFEAYKKPSKAKIEVWNWWKNFAKENDLTISIRTYNNQIFTLVLYNEKDTYIIYPTRIEHYQSPTGELIKIY